MLNPQVKESNIADSVCVGEWTTTIRPPTSNTNRVKERQIRELNCLGALRDYEEDHLVALCIGGRLTDPRNVWPEPRDGKWAAKFKD